MKAESYIEEEFDKEFKEAPVGDHCIRYKILHNNKKAKTVVFKVDYIKITPKQQYKLKACLEESNEILKKENESFNENKACYKWMGSSFEEVDCKEQKWFNFMNRS